MTTPTQPQYCLIIQNCFFDAQYNTLHFPKSGNKMRLGLVYFRDKVKHGQQYASGEGRSPWGKNCPTREYRRADGHAWTETPEGHVIDWYINWKLRVPAEDKCIWSKEELAELGIRYEYYDNEEGILKKTLRSLGGKCDKKKNPNEECSCEWSKRIWTGSGQFVNEFYFKSNPRIPKD